HLSAYYLWEAALKLLGSVAIVSYAELPSHDANFRERLRNLARPSTGNWWEFVRLLVPALAEAGDSGFVPLRDFLFGRTRDDLPRLAGLDGTLREVLSGATGAQTTVRVCDLFDRLVQYRNREIGHGVVGHRRPEFHQRIGDALTAGLAEMLGRIDVLAG